MLDGFDGYPLIEFWDLKACFVKPYEVFPKGLLGLLFYCVHETILITGLLTITCETNISANCSKLEIEFVRS